MRIKVGDLVRHIGSRGKLTCGIVTAIRGDIKDDDYSCDVLWESGRHSAHSSNYLRLLEVE